ncbi:MAG: 4-(cytidine 5'-diphospho)-2-C-methyl-D-erythritol kinase [Acidobacteria bacterium]|nr:4-(cytidine 5'-diphospho)-2-C-methyl-D-erythritol kinase [Acidobacteriota bacterium]
MPTTPIEVRAHAKINWMLRVLGKRSDGFHELETIFQSISLHDTLRVYPGEPLSLSCNEPSIPTDASNLAMRAAAAMIDRFGAPACRIELEKRIPAGGGLGGGSSDAAATFRVLAPLCRRPPSHEELADLALALGSDVPFFLEEGTAYATGRGERLVPLRAQERIPLLLLLPDEKVMTPDAYALLRSGRDEGRLPEGDAVGPDRCKTAARGSLLDDPSILINDLEAPVFDKLPRLESLLDALRATHPAWARMSGSGSTLVGAFRDHKARDAAVGTFRGLVETVLAETVTLA